MLKKTGVIIIIFIMLLSFIGCENKNSKNELQNGSEVEETVSVVFPSSFFSETPKEFIKLEANNLGAKDVIFNEDGSVQYIMSKSNYEELKDKNIEDLENAITNFTSKDITDIDYDKTNSEFRIYSTLTSLDFTHGLTISSLMFFENYRQAIEGKKVEDIDCTVKIINSHSGEVFYCEKWSDLNCGAVNQND